MVEVLSEGGVGDVEGLEVVWLNRKRCAIEIESDVAVVMERIVVADPGQTSAPVARLRSFDPNKPGMTITGVVSRDSAPAR